MSFPITMLYQPGATGSLTNSQYIAEFNNIINNMIPESIDDYSANASEMRLTTDPGESGTESLATTMSEEIERLRYAIKEAKNMWGSVTYWYETPTVGSLTRTTNADAFSVYVQTDTFTNAIATLKTDEENSGSFFYVKCISDVNGTPSTDFSINQDGDVVCGAVTAAGALVVGGSNNISTTTGLIRTTDIALYETTAGTGNAITIACPASPTAYSITVPAAVPGATEYLSMSSAGVIDHVSADDIATAMTATGADAIAADMTSTGADAIAADMTATGADAIAADISSTGCASIFEDTLRIGAASHAKGGFESSTVSASFNTTSTSDTDLTSASISFTPSGNRPVLVKLRPGGVAPASGGLQILASGAATASAEISLFRGATEVGRHTISVQQNENSIGTYYPLTAFEWLDTPTAGTYTYQVKVKAGSSTTVTVTNYILTGFHL